MSCPKLRDPQQCDSLAQGFHEKRVIKENKSENFLKTIIKVKIQTMRQTCLSLILSQKNRSLYYKFVP